MTFKIDTVKDLNDLIKVTEEIKLNAKEIRDNPGNYYEATMANALAAVRLLNILGLVDMDE